MDKMSNPTYVILKVPSFHWAIVINKVINLYEGEYMGEHNFACFKYNY